MPDRFEREVGRIMRFSERPIAMSLEELVVDLDQLRAEAEEGGHLAVAAAIGAAADAARREMGEEPRAAAGEPSSARAS